MNETTFHFQTSNCCWRATFAIVFCFQLMKTSNSTKINKNDAVKNEVLLGSTKVDF